MSSTPEFCSECGGDAIPHKLTYFNLLMDEIMRPLIAPGPLLRYLGYAFHDFEQLVIPNMMQATVALGIAKKIEEPDEHTMLLALMIWNEAKARGIDMWEWRLFNLPRNLFVATYPNGKRISFEGMPEPKGGNRHVWWMDNKAIFKQKFSKLGFPIATGGSSGTLRYALSIYRRLTPPVIVKPYAGSASRHTTLHIDTEEELTRAYNVATQVAPFAVVEEELYGAVYRATVVNGKLSATLRRDPPHVIGDGTSTISALVEKENEHPARNGPYFHKIKLDDAARAELAWQGHAFESVPKKGEKVLLHQKVNWSVGGTTADVSEEVHPDNVALFEASSVALRAPVVGIDFIIPDIRRSWKEQERSGFIECNSMPFFDNHHLPFEGKPRNVAADIWDMVSPA